MLLEGLRAEALLATSPGQSAKGSQGQGWGYPWKARLVGQGAAEPWSPPHSCST